MIKFYKYFKSLKSYFLILNLYFISFFAYPNSDLDSFNGDVELFFKSLEDKINKIF